jgi:putative tricarboxylic transport membrane protein
MMKDAVSSFVLLLIAFGYYSLATDINRSALADEIGAAGVPIVYAALLAGIGLALALKVMLVLYRMPSMASLEQGSLRGEGRTLLRTIGMLIIGVCYLMSITVMGYFISMAGLIFLVALYQGEKAGWRLAGIAVGGAVCFWVLFDRLLGTEMPSGFWSTL